jgi:hypothetical protein
VALFAIGIFNLGWLVLLSKKYRRQLSVVERRTIIGSLISLFIWSILMYLPGSTMIHQGSYATILLLMVVGGRLISRMGHHIITWVFAIQLVLFLYAWVIYDYLVGVASLKSSAARILCVFACIAIMMYVNRRKQLVMI